MAAKAVIVLVVGALIAGCASDDSEIAQPPTADATGDEQRALGVDRGEMGGLSHVPGDRRGAGSGGLGELAPSIVGEYFPGQSAKQLARKADVCAGAKPERRSHFFTADGQFGSVDLHGERVDDAPYSVVDEDTLRLSLEFGDETYQYRIVDNELTLEPVIRSRSKREALANPLDFSLAAHSAAVAYSGHAWKRVDCAGWCYEDRCGERSDPLAARWNRSRQAEATPRVGASRRKAAAAFGRGVAASKRSRVRR